MNRFRYVLMIFAILMVVVGSVNAQEDETDLCSVEAIEERVDAAFDEYDVTRIIDSSLDDALSSLEILQVALDDIYDECNAIRLARYTDDAQSILDLLREGGYVVYVRHTSTDRSQADTDLSSCETQRNLDEQGRLDAQYIGEVFPTLDIPVGLLISTQYCRTLETTELAFGEPDEVILRTELEATINTLLSTIPEDGTNTFIVAHIGSLFNYTDVESVFEEGDALIFEPFGNDEYNLLARIPLLSWEVFELLVSEAE